MSAYVYGFLELVDEPESMRGCIVATLLKNNADNVNKDNSINASDNKKLMED